MTVVYDGDPFKDVAEWIQETKALFDQDYAIGDHPQIDVPFEALEIVLRESLKMQGMGKLSIQCAGWMYHYALQLEERGFKLKDVPMQSVMDQLSRELKLPDLLEVLQPDDKPTIITKA